MTEISCLACGTPFDERHHPEGRDACARYFSSKFRLPVCKKCHDLLGVAQRAAGLERRFDPAGRLRRVGSDFVVIGERRAGHVIPTPAEVFLYGGLALQAIADAFEASA